MGARIPCESRWCSREAEVICQCSGIKLCYHCFGIHSYENQNLSHYSIKISEIKDTTYVTPGTITMNHLQFHRLLYRSPEGTTEVFEGEVVGIGKVAIKIMICRDQNELERKQREATIQGTLDHPNICKYHACLLDESHKSGFKFVLVMEFSEYGDIEHEIDLRRLKRDYWRETDVMRHMTELIDAFATLQDNNIVHGDIKPRNLFISLDTRLKIGDFGESIQEIEALRTRTYHITGTVLYFSPLLFKAYLDIIKGRITTGSIRHNPVKSDVYSLGLTFLHMCTLNKPSDLNNIEVGLDTLQKEVEKKIRHIPYSDTVKQILRNMLQVHEAKRYDFRQLKKFIIERATPSVSIGHILQTPSTQTSEQPYPDDEYHDQTNFTQYNSSQILLALTQQPGKINVYDINKKSFSEITSHRIQPSCRIALLEEFIFITGGLRTPTQTFTINFETRDGKRLNDLNQGRSWHSIVIHQDELYVIGGRSIDKRSALSSVELWKDGNWQSLESLQEARENATALSFLDCIYIFGGSKRERTRWIHLTTIERYINSQWEVLQLQLPIGMAGVGLLPIGPEQILLVGGTREQEPFSTQVYQLDIPQGDIVLKNSLPDGDAFWSQSWYQDNQVMLLVGTIIGIYKYNKETEEWDVEIRY